jgi:hypothetical protein
MLSGRGLSIFHFTDSKLQCMDQVLRATRQFTGFMRYLTFFKSRVSFGVAWEALRFNSSLYDQRVLAYRYNLFQFP